MASFGFGRGLRDSTLLGASSSFSAAVSLSVATNRRNDVVASYADRNTRLASRYTVMVA